MLRELLDKSKKVTGGDESCGGGGSDDNESDKDVRGVLTKQ